MGKHKKKDKKDKKNKAAEAPGDDFQAEVRRLRQENEQLRATLEEIAELAAVARSNDDAGEVEDEGDEYDELTRDVDDEIAHRNPTVDGQGIA